MRYLVKAKVKPRKEKSLLEAVESGLDTANFYGMGHNEMLTNQE